MPWLREGSLPFLLARRQLHLPRTCAFLEKGAVNEPLDKLSGCDSPFLQAAKPKARAKCPEILCFASHAGFCHVE